MPKGSLSLTPVKTRFHHEITSSFESPARQRISVTAGVNECTEQSPDVSLLSTRLLQSKSNKRQLEKEQQILMNKIKHLEEEELKARMRLAKASKTYENHEQYRKIKEAYIKDQKRKEEMEQMMKNKVQQMSSIERERRKLMKNKMTTFFVNKKKEMEDLRQKKTQIKKLNEQLRQEMKHMNYERASKTRIQRLNTKLEIEKARERSLQEKTRERKEAKENNEQVYKGIKGSEVKSKMEVVKIIKGHRTNFEQTHAYLKSLSNEKVAEAIEQQLQQEEQHTRQIAMTIEELKRQELEAKKRLEDTKKNLEKIETGLANLTDRKSVV